MLRHTGPVLPIAHAGHWLVYILYAVPVLIVLGSIAVTMVRDRRAGGREADDQPSAMARSASSSAAPSSGAGAPSK